YSIMNNHINLTEMKEKKALAIIKDMNDDLVFTGNPFFGKTNYTSVFFNIINTKSRRVVLEASINRTEIQDLFLKRKQEIGIAFIFLIIVSFTLGQFFSNTITKPLKELVANAEKISKGQKDVTFSINRHDEIGLLSNTLSEMNRNLNKRIQAMDIMNKIDKAVLSSISRKDLLNSVISFICDYIDKSTVVMALRDDIGSGFELISAARKNKISVIISNPYIPDELLGRNTLDTLKKSCLVSEDHNLIEVLKKQLHLPEKTKRFYNVPIYLKEEYLGSLFVVKNNQQDFTSDEQQTLIKLGDQAGVAMQSIFAVEELDTLQIGSIRALSSAIDTKSKWTSGHSSRVAHLSKMLGTALGLNEMQLKRLVISAHLHDIGKIGIPERILDKPDKLTEEEFDSIKQHPETGYQISRNIPNYEDICDGIRYHHERWNGTGYPKGLSGKDIPLFGRIIAIADVFDAVSAKRPYREAMPEEICIKIIRDNRGVDFDPELADLFLEALENTKNHLHIQPTKVTV
ncbi:MAG: HD domain-containing protein, partial [Spirochaetales bacterium]|nr:HD domain-containing protein [Spirochaetales bacterium]